jgi:hypothetical protein
MKDSSKPGNKIGRPSTYTPEVAKLICDRIAEGESLRSICRDEGMPAHQTVDNWLIKDPEFAAKYARAREAQADVMDDRQMEIIQRLDARDLDPHSAKVMIGVLQWRASKLAPKRYGDKIDVNHGGQLEINDTQLDARIAALGPAFAAALGQAATGGTSQSS